MKINKTLSEIVNIDEREVKYIYRMTEKMIRNRQAFGIVDIVGEYSDLCAVEF